MDGWLARVRHDLVKHAAWRARDLKVSLVAGRPARASDVGALRRALLDLPDAEGRPAGALAVWRALRDELPEPEPEPEKRAAIAPALDRFESALSALQDRLAAAPDDAPEVEPLCAAILQLEVDFDRMARDVKSAGAVR